MVQYSTIGGVAKESVGNNIITNFRHAWGLSKAGLTKVIRNFIVNGGLTKRKKGKIREVRCLPVKKGENQNSRQIKSSKKKITRLERLYWETYRNRFKVRMESIGRGRKTIVC